MALRGGSAGSGRRSDATAWWSGWSGIWSRGPWPSRGGPPIEMVAEELGLSDDQRTQWKAIHEKARETGETLMKTAGAAKEAFDKALQAENADPMTVGQAAIAMHNAHQKVEAHHQATIEAVKATLTPEQLAKFEEREKHRPGGAPSRGGFAPGGPQRRRGPGGK